MKTKRGNLRYLPLLLGLVFSMFATNALAQAFSQTNSDGVTIWYELVERDNYTGWWVTSVGSNTYSGSVVIPEEVTNEQGETRQVVEIREGAFWECPELTSVTLPSTLRRIGNYAFNGCSKLTTINIPNSVTEIGPDAFCKSGLVSAVIGNGVTTIPETAFWGCSKLKYVTGGGNLKSIGRAAFENCSQLTYVQLAEGLKEIGESAFHNCGQLSSITIPSTVTSIGSVAFWDCTKLSSVISYIANPFPTEGFHETIKNQNVALYVPSNSLSKYYSVSNWSLFPTIEPVKEGCKTPIISYANGKLSFSCETPYATLQWSVTDELAQSGSAAEVDLTPACEVAVYAEAKGRPLSDLAKATLWWVEVGQTGGVVTGLKEIQAVPVLIKTGGGKISLEGLADGTTVNIFDVSGNLIGLGEASGGRVAMDTSLPSGSIVIVKIGEKGIKVVL